MKVEAAGYSETSKTVHSKTGQKKTNRIDTPLQTTNSLIAFCLDLLILEDGTDRLPRNVGKELPL
jgi:hypothetical protein